MVRIGSPVSLGRREGLRKKFSPVKLISRAGIVFFVLWGFGLVRLLNKSNNNEPSVNKVDIPIVRNVRRQPDAGTPDDPGIVTIGFAVSVTGCGSDPITEGAAVLKHSIHRASVRGTLGGRYDYAMYAIYHPNAESCALTLKDLGYTLLKRDTPVAVKDIEGDFLRERIEENGCCGEKELIKFEAYTLTEHPVVVHLDLDVLVLQPLDELFDIMLKNEKHKVDAARMRQILQWPDRQPLPDRINAFYTHDYNMAKPHFDVKPVQGGFLVIRPDMDVYKEYVEIIRKGDFRPGGGWGGITRAFYGSMTFQGLVPYYYLVLHKGEAVELNRCIYNQMCDNPRTGRTVNDVVNGDCRTGEEECEDCRSRPLEDVYTVHFTLCQKPWECNTHSQDMIQHRLCRKLTKEWYHVRSEMEKSWGRSEASGSFQTDQFYGYCSGPGKNGYLHIDKPYGGPLEKQ